MSNTSPCIGDCRLREGKCRGCRRTIEEIVTWREMTEQQRAVVMERLKQREPDTVSAT